MILLQMRFELSVNTRARKAEDILSVDFKGQLRPNLEARSLGCF